MERLATKARLGCGDVGGKGEISARGLYLLAYLFAESKGLPISRDFFLFYGSGLAVWILFFGGHLILTGWGFMEWAGVIILPIPHSLQCPRQT